MQLFVHIHAEATFRWIAYFSFPKNNPGWRHALKASIGQNTLVLEERDPKIHRSAGLF